MDIFLQDPSAIPRPPEEVRIIALKATPWPDGRRVRVSLEITPFQQKPNGELVIIDQGGEEVASLAIIETITPRMEFTIHLKREKPSGVYTALATIYYLPAGPDLQAPPLKQNQEVELSTEHLVVDRREVEFEIPG